MSLHSEPNQNDRKKHQQRNTTKLPTPSTLFQWREQKQKELLSDSPIKRIGAASASSGLGGGGHGGQDQDCRIARKQAIDENARSGVRDAFIPECDGGDFRQVQCYQVSYKNRQIKFSFSEKATKICRNGPQGFNVLSNVKSLRTIAPNFCGLLRKV